MSTNIVQLIHRDKCYTYTDVVEILDCGLKTVGRKHEQVCHGRKTYEYYYGYLTIKIPPKYIGKRVRVILLVTE